MPKCARTSAARGRGRGLALQVVGEGPPPGTERGAPAGGGGRGGGRARGVGGGGGPGGTGRGAPQGGEDAVRRAGRRQGIFGAGDGHELRPDVPEAEDLAGKLMPGAGSGVGEVVEAVALSLHYPDDPLGKVPGEGRRDEFVVFHLYHIALGGRPQHGANDMGAPTGEDGGPADGAG